MADALHIQWSITVKLELHDCVALSVGEDSHSIDIFHSAGI